MNWINYELKHVPAITGQGHLFWIYLKNPVYIGKIRWSKGNENILVDGLHPAIIDDGTFNNAQQIRISNTRTPTRADFKLQNPLAGLVYCKKCGSLMNRLGPNNHCRYDTIRCSNKYCENVSAPIDLVERNMLTELKNWFRVYKLSIKDNNKNNHLETRKLTLKKMYDDVKKDRQADRKSS